MFRRTAASVLLLFTALGAGARTRPQYGGTLRIETQRDPWQGADALARRLTMDGLTEIDADGAARSALALQWTSQSGDHHWEFRLRAGVRFHDGTPLTAAAVVASLNAACGDSCPWKTVRAVGQTLVFTGDSPIADLPAQLARAEFLISRQSASGAAVGTGAFLAPEMTNGVITLTANDDYWGGRPFLDTVEIRGKRSIRDQWLDLSVGKADIVDVPPALLRTAQLQHLKTLTSEPTDLLALQISETGSLANEKLRQAIALAVDRNALFNVIFQKQGEVTASLLPGSQSGYSFLFPTQRNLERAAELRGGANPQITLAPEDANPELQLTTERIALNLREAGFRVQVISSNEVSRADLVLRRIHLEGVDAQSSLAQLLETFDGGSAAIAHEPEAGYHAERDFLTKLTLVPLLYLPRCYALSERVRDLQLAPDGTPMIGDAGVADSRTDNAAAKSSATEEGTGPQ